MSIVLFLLVFSIGAAFGSFLNVIIDRIGTDKSIFIGRSACDSCGHTLEMPDLIPLFSFLFLKGRCRYCKKKIPARNFTVELITGFLFVLLFSEYQLGFFGLPTTLFLAVSFFILIPIFFIDLEQGIIPDNLVLFLGILTLIFMLLSGNDFLSHFLSGIVAFSVFFGLFYFTKGKGMGFGDVKFAFVMGFLLGFPVSIVGFYAAFLTGALISLILIIAGKKKLKGSTIPFGPFMVWGIFVALFFSSYILSLFPFL